MQRGMRGAALVEAAIVFPTLMLFLLSIVQWGYLIAASMVLNDAAATAARSYITNPDPTGTWNATTWKSFACGLTQPLLDTAKCNVADVTAQGLPAPTVINGVTVYQFTITYNFPVTFSLAVPNASGGVLALSAKIKMK